MAYPHLERLIHQVEHIDGVIVECGVGNGGSLVEISSLIHYRSIRNREIFGYDSFQGLPRPTEYDKYYKEGRCVFPIDDVQQIVNRYSKIKYNIVPGWFKDTLGTYPKLPIAVLHLDVDVYSSYKECLETLYQYVQPGGLILFDEYSRPIELEKWPGAKIAIDEFFNPLGIEIQISQDTGKAYIFKPCI
jgi:hypothetical protein